MKKHFLFTVSLLLGLLAMPLMASEDVFTVDVLVTNQGNSEFNSASKRGLAVVAERIVGSPVVLRRAEVVEALNEADTYIEQFNYRNISDKDVLPEMLKTQGVEKAKSATYVFQVRYSPESVEQLLQQEAQAAQEISGTTLIWLLMDKGGQSHFVNQTNDPEVTTYITQQAQEAGLEVVFPLFDFQDLQTVTAADVRGGFSETVLQGSERYDVDTVVSAVVEQVHSELWISQWRNISLPEQPYKDNASELAHVIDGAIAWLSDDQKGALSDSQPTLSTVSNTHLWIGYIKTTAQYTQMLGLFSAMPDVVDVSPTFVSSEGMVLTVTPRISLRVLEQRLTNVRYLQQIPRPDAVVVPSTAEIFFDYSG